MPGWDDLRLRAAGPGDTLAVAELHADSWRRHYRGAFSESDGEVVGLAHTILDEDATWGAFPDNLHVRHGLKRQGIGTRLLALTAQSVLAWNPLSGLYLWVLELNSDALAFYTARGGVSVERGDVLPPGGDRARLNGKPVNLRYAWRDPSKLLLAADPPGLLPGAGGWTVAVQGFGAFLVPRGGGAVGLQDQGPAFPVDRHVVMEPAQQDAILDAGLAAVGLGLGVVDFAGRRGLQASPRLRIAH